MARGTYRHRRGALIAAPSHLQIFRILFPLFGTALVALNGGHSGQPSQRLKNEHILTAAAVGRDETTGLLRFIFR
jgi:hypothetical protein